MEEQDKVKRTIDILSSIGNSENSEDERGRDKEMKIASLPILSKLIVV